MVVNLTYSEIKKKKACHYYSSVHTFNFIQLSVHVFTSSNLLHIISFLNAQISLIYQIPFTMIHSRSHCWLLPLDLCLCPAKPTVMLQTDPQYPQIWHSCMEF